MLTFFIRRPRFAMVIALLLTFVGAVSLKLIPVEQYPAIPGGERQRQLAGRQRVDVAEAIAARWRPSSTASIICCMWSPPARMRGRTA